MIKSRFDDLRRDKAYRERRSLPIRVIAAETGLALGTVHRISKGSMERVYISTLDTLCAYFGVKAISDVLEYVPDTPKGHTP